MESRKIVWIVFMLSMITYFIGDIVSTHYALLHGAVESNPLFIGRSLYFIIIMKTLFFVLMFYEIRSLNVKKLEVISTFLCGIVFMTGLLTIIINTGIYYR